MKITRLLKVTIVLIVLVMATGCQSAPTADQIAQGKKLLPVLCTRCHPLSTVRDHRDDAAGWRKVITRMKQHGAQFSAEEEEAIAAYLAETQPKSGSRSPVNH